MQTTTFLPSQSQNQLQRLMMRAQMQQALHVLQLPIQDLEKFLELEAIQNPILEIDPTDNHEVERENDDSSDTKELDFQDGDFSIFSEISEQWEEFFQSTDLPHTNLEEEQRKRSYIESSWQGEETLRSYLIRQVHETFEDPTDQNIAILCIDYLDQHGRLDTSLEEISKQHAISIDKLESILKTIQTFEPYGVGARSTQECLLIELKNLGKEDSLAYLLIENHYKDLLHNRIPLIEKALKHSARDIANAIQQDLAPLSLYPTLRTKRAAYDVPRADLTLIQEKDEWIAQAFPVRRQPLRIQSRYLKMLTTENLSPETRTFLEEKVAQARWLEKNIQERNRILEEIGKSLISYQIAFLTNPQAALAPLTMQQIADEIGVHESTIARAVAGKWISCPRGLILIRSLFSYKYLSTQEDELSQNTVLDTLKKLIEAEDKQKPLSDEALAKALQKEGIVCARRTVAKHRSSLGIGNAQQRKSYLSPL